MNIEEMILCFNHPLCARDTNKLKDIALEEAPRQFPHDLFPCTNSPETDTKADAFRHAYWMALLTKHVNPSCENWAKKIGDAHEYGGSGADHIMDLHNNEVGRKVAESNPGASDEQLSTIIKNLKYSFYNKNEILNATLPSNELVYIVDCPQKNVVIDGKFGFIETEWDNLTSDKIVQDVPKTSKYLSEWSDNVSGSVKTQRHNIGQPSGTPKDVIHVDGTSSANIEFANGETKYKINEHKYSRYIRCGISTHNWSSYFQFSYYVKGRRGTNFKYTASLTGSESGGQIPAQDPFAGAVNSYRMGVPSFRARTINGNVKNFDWVLEANKSNSFSESLGTGVSGDEITVDGEIYSYAMTVQINGSYGLGYSEIILCTIVPWDTAVANLDFKLNIEII